MNRTLDPKNSALFDKLLERGKHRNTQSQPIPSSPIPQLASEFQTRVIHALYSLRWEVARHRSPKPACYTPTPCSVISLVGSKHGPNTFQRLWTANAHMGIFSPVISSTKHFFSDFCIGLSTRTPASEHNARYMTPTRRRLIFSCFLSTLFFFKSLGQNAAWRLRQFFITYISRRRITAIRSNNGEGNGYSNCVCVTINRAFDKHTHVLNNEL